MFIGDDRAQVTRADVMASNGVMHVIDAVILPREALDLVDVARNSDGATFADLVTQKVSWHVRVIGNLHLLVSGHVHVIEHVNVDTDCSPSKCFAQTHPLSFHFLSCAPPSLTPLMHSNSLSLTNPVGEKKL